MKSDVGDIKTNLRELASRVEKVEGIALMAHVNAEIAHRHLKLDEKVLNEMRNKVQLGDLL